MKDIVIDKTAGRIWGRVAVKNCKGAPDWIFVDLISHITPSDDSSSPALIIFNFLPTHFDETPPPYPSNLEDLC